MSDLSRQTAVPDAEINLAAGRTRLAYDRTMLSWIRTATALITFGFSITNSFESRTTRSWKELASSAPMSLEC